MSNRQLAMTPEGPVVLRVISSGDVVLNSKMEEVIVGGKLNLGLRELFKVTLEDGRTLPVHDKQMFKVLVSEEEEVDPEPEAPEEEEEEEVDPDPEPEAPEEEEEEVDPDPEDPEGEEVLEEGEEA